MDNLWMGMTLLMDISRDRKIMKKNLMAVSLTLALMPALLYSAPKAGQESVDVLISLDNVSALGDIFSGKTSPQAFSALQETANPPQSREEEVKEVVEAVVIKPIVNEKPPVAPAVNRVSTYKGKSAAQKQKEAQELQATFQQFSEPVQAVDYLRRAAFWADKAPLADQPYAYQTRLSLKDQQNFQQQYLDKVAQGELSGVELVTAKGLTPQGKVLYQLLLESEGEGLIPSLYHVGRIENLLQSDSLAAHQAEIVTLLYDGGLNYIRDMGQGMPEVKRKDPDWLLKGRSMDVSAVMIEALSSQNMRGVFSNLMPQYPEYHNLKRALAAFKAQESEPEPVKVAAGGTIKAGMNGERVIQMRDRLNYRGYAAGNAENYDAKMVEAVKAFQRTHLLEPDGAPGQKTLTELNRSNDERIKQIQVNLERWRWMPRSMGEHYVSVDIPGFRYSVMKDGEEILTAKTIVGRDARKTPVFMSPMSYIVFSPFWHVPRSMAVKDFLPRLKQDPYALTRSKIRVFRGGKELDPGSVNWSQYHSNNFPFQLRQDPGDFNSLGRVKFMFPNEHAIYLHDTPTKSLFNRTSRDFSSGCVRIENPEELAEYFLGELGWDQNRISSAFSRSSEAHVNLSKDKKIPVYTLYMTTRVEGDSISFRTDIYNKDKVLIEVFHQLQ